MKKLLGKIEDYKIGKSPADVNADDVTHFDLPKKSSSPPMRPTESRRAFCLGYFSVLTNFDVQIRFALNNTFHIKSYRTFRAVEFPYNKSVAANR